MRKFILTGFIGTALLLGGCSGKIESEAKYPTGADRAATGGDNIYGEAPSIFGNDGLNLLGGKKRGQDNEGGSGIGVNAFLWRAAIDTVSFMPLNSADPFGGVILTDWYSPPEKTNERFKMNVFILGKELRSDGVRVRLFRQEFKGGKWTDVAVADDTSIELENTILTRARQMRVSQLERGQ